MSAIRWFCTFLALLTWHSPDVAEAATDTAEALFERGRTLLSEGKTQAACEAFTRSQELEPAVGTLLNLGACHKEQGNLVRAYRTFEEAALLATSEGQDERSAIATALAEQIAPRLVQLTLEAKGDAKTPPKMRIRLTSNQGAPLELPMTAIGAKAPLLLDPGQHVLRFSRPGFRESLLTFTASEGQHRNIIVPDLTSVSQRRARPKEASPPLPNDRSPSILPWLLGGAGASTMGVGFYFLLSANQKTPLQEHDCAPSCSKQQELEQKSAQERQSVLGTSGVVGLSVGGAAVVGSLVWLLLENQHSEKLHIGAQIESTGAIATVGGSF